jgi:hypothetical protein
MMFLERTTANALIVKNVIDEIIEGISDKLF